MEPKSKEWVEERKTRVLEKLESEAKRLGFPTHYHRTRKLAQDRMDTEDGEKRVWQVSQLASRCPLGIMEFMDIEHPADPQASPDQTKLRKDFIRQAITGWKDDGDQDNGSAMFDLLNDYFEFTVKWAAYISDCTKENVFQTYMAEFDRSLHHVSTVQTNSQMEREEQDILKSV